MIYCVSQSAAARDGPRGHSRSGAVKASAQTLQLANVTEFTTSCNFCSCGCGMVGSVREGKLIKLEGDFDHVVNEGALCVKGMAMFPTHSSRCATRRRAIVRRAAISG